MGGRRRKKKESVKEKKAKKGREGNRKGKEKNTATTEQWKVEKKKQTKTKNEKHKRKGRGSGTHQVAFHKNNDKKKATKITKKSPTFVLFCDCWLFFCVRFFFFVCLLLLLQRSLKGEDRSSKERVCLVCHAEVFPQREGRCHSGSGPRPSHPLSLVVCCLVPVPPFETSLPHTHSHGVCCIATTTTGLPTSRSLCWKTASRCFASSKKMIPPQWLFVPFCSFFFSCPSPSHTHAHRRR